MLLTLLSGRVTKSVQQSYRIATSWVSSYDSQFPLCDLFCLVFFLSHFTDLDRLQILKTSSSTRVLWQNKTYISLTTQVWRESGWSWATETSMCFTLIAFYVLTVPWMAVTTHSPLICSLNWRATALKMPHPDIGNAQNWLVPFLVRIWNG